MKKRLLLLSTVLCAITGNVNAQQDKLITHFIFDKMSINPGSTGMEPGICGTAIYRNQWDKVNGAPNSAVFNVEANMNRWFPGGLGLAFFHDAIGFNRQNNLLLNYSYPLSIGSAGTLGIGVGVGMINFGQNPTWVPPTTAIDVTLPVGFSATNLDLNAGLYWKGAQDYYVGISSTHLSESLMRQTVGTISYQYQTARHYYLMAGKKIGVGTKGSVVDIQGLMRTDLTKFSGDINARYIWRRMIYGGLTYRTVDAIGVMVGGTFKNITLGYSYDFTTNKLASISRGSHEILLRYCYQFPAIPITKSKHPRWL